MIIQLSESFIHAISWTVIHSIWQISLLALCLIIANHYLPKKQSSLRYNIGLSLMALGFITGMATFLWYYLDPGAGNAGTEILLTLEQSEFIKSSSELSQTWSSIIHNHSALITQIWIIGVIILTVKLLIGYGYIQYLNHHSGLALNAHLEYKLERLKSRLGITTNIIIAETHKIVSPIVTGFIKPTILFPVGLVTQLEPEEIEAILVHELGHIKRNDWLFNMIQSLVEIIYYYHPAMWWISAQVRKERENCCDDYALQNGYDRISYAKILVKLKEIELSHKPMLAMSFLNSKNELMNRIKRILGQYPARNAFREKLIALVLICTVAVAYAGNWSKNENINIPFLMNDEELKVELSESDMIDIPSFRTVADTIPGKKKSKTFTLKQNDGKSYKIESENGEITRMEVDGEVISPEHYDQYIDEMPHGGKWDYHFDFDNDFGDMPFNMNMDGMKFFEMDEEQSRRLAESMERLSERLGRMDFSELEDYDWEGFDHMEFRSFDMDSLMSGMWGKDGESFQQLEEMMKRLNDMRFEELEGLNRLEELEGLNRLEELEHLKELEQLKGLEHFDFEFPDFNSFNYRWESNANQTMSRSLNQDGLLKIDEENEIELTDKHLKINGEKQPGNIHDKYKRMFEKSTGMKITDDFKVKFNVTGKESKSRMRRI
jgi:beta-lactamase regulating signal transducer with metallopeptidase domain